MTVRAVPDTLLARILSNRRILVGGGLLLLIMILCLASMPWTLHVNGNFYYDKQHPTAAEQEPQLHPFWMSMGTTKIGQSLLGRCLIGGVISLTVGIAAAAVSVFLGVCVGVLAGYQGGWVDGLLMRTVDVLYGLPYILMVILLKIALERPLAKLNPSHLAHDLQFPILLLAVFAIFSFAVLWASGSIGQLVSVSCGIALGLLLFVPGVFVKARVVGSIGAGMTVIAPLLLLLPSKRFGNARKTLLIIFASGILLLPLTSWVGPHLGGDFSNQAVNLIVMFLAIGLVSWLTMARVIRGQVLSLRSMPFIDAARAVGTPGWRIFLYHLLPNLIGPITVYTTLTIPSAILQESTLSFLGIGIQPPLPTWGSLASESMQLALNPIHSRWWLLVFPCTLLAITLLSLNFLGDGLREVFDPKRRSANV